jgi:uncharacterized protein (TIGR02444 family)
MPNAAAAGTCESAFWRFSLAFYARPQVPAACLELQDSAGVDVNLMLYLLFLAYHQRQLDRADVARIDAAIRQWRDLAVVPLRTLRRKLKTGIAPMPAADTEALRSAVKRIELDAERIEQEWLELHAPPSSLGAPSTSRTGAARANLAAYHTLLGGLPDAAVETLLASYGEYIA